jgi:anti-sigma regulatory factor (Ser/Thr protein kinase)
LELEILPQPGEVTIVVRDEGAGIRPKAPMRDPDSSWRLGMPLMASLSDGLEVAEGPEGRGTEIRLKFSVA